MSLTAPRMSQAKVTQAEHQLIRGELLEASLRQLIRSAASLAAFCEHVEHNEPSSVDSATEAGATLRHVAQRLAEASGISLRKAYEARIRAVEATSLIGEARLLGAERLVEARTWQAVQAAQLIHDRYYHPDVFGLSKLDQIRHYTFHVTKLVGLMTEAIDSATWADFETRRLPDLAIFGVKIATVCNERLTDALISPHD